MLIYGREERVRTARLVVEGNVSTNAFEEVDLGIRASGSNDLQALLLGQLDDKTSWPRQLRR